jgi:pimeloyl-ACP methyl ester carboxylesterase
VRPAPTLCAWPRTWPPSSTRHAPAPASRSAAGTRSHPKVDAVVERLRAPGALSASLGLYRAVLPPESLLAPPPALPPIMAPAMGVWGSEDFALTERSMTDTERYVVGGWRYERIEGAGHWMMLDAPDTVNRLLLDFIGSQARADPSPAA